MLLTKLIAENAFSSDPKTLTQKLFEHLIEARKNAPILIFAPETTETRSTLESLAFDARRQNAELLVLAAHTKDKTVPIAVVHDYHEGLAAIASQIYNIPSYVHAAKKNKADAVLENFVGKKAIFAQLNPVSLQEAVAKLLNDPEYWLEALPTTLQEVTLAEMYEPSPVEDTLPLAEGLKQLLVQARAYQQDGSEANLLALHKDYEAVLEALGGSEEADASLVELVENEMQMTLQESADSLDAALVMYQADCMKAVLGS